MQKNIKKPKCKSKHGTIYKLYLPKRLTIRPMLAKYFHLGVAVKLPEGIQTTATTSSLQSYGLRMEEAKDNIKLHQMIHFHIANQS